MMRARTESRAPVTTVLMPPASPKRTTVQTVARSRAIRLMAAMGTRAEGESREIRGRTDPGEIRSGPADPRRRGRPRHGLRPGVRHRPRPGRWRVLGHWRDERSVGYPVGRRI